MYNIVPVPLPYVVAPDAELIQCDGIPIFYGHFDGLEMCVHGHIHPCDRAMYLKMFMDADSFFLLH
jgi:hypothetical protein